MLATSLINAVVGDLIYESFHDRREGKEPRELTVTQVGRKWLSASLKTGGMVYRFDRISGAASAVRYSSRSEAYVSLEALLEVREKAKLISCLRQGVSGYSFRTNLNSQQLRSILAQLGIKEPND